MTDREEQMRDEYGARYRTEVEDHLLGQTDPHRQQRLARYTERAARRLPLFCE